MTTITLRLPRPHAAQRAILDSPARYKVIDCGRRFGKTELFCNVLLNGHSPGRPGALAGMPVAYVSLTYKNVKELWGRLLDTLPDELVAYKNESDQYLELAGGGSVECWTFERFTSARGRAYAGICLDEAAQTRSLMDAWQEVFIAMLMDYEGWAMVGSTPQGFNFFYDLFLRGKDSAFPDWDSWLFTSYDNPWIKPYEIDQVKAMLPDIVFRREYMAEFAVSEGLVYSSFSVEQNVTADAEYNPDLDVYWAVDDGYSHGQGVGTAGHHPRVVLFAQQHPDGSMTIFDEYYRSLQPSDLTLSECLERPYNFPQLALVDSSAAELRGRLSSAGIPNGPASHKVSEGIKVVRRFILNGAGVRQLFIHPRCVNTIREVQSYRYNPALTGADAGEPKPYKMDDHCPDCLRYLLWNFR